MYTSEYFDNHIKLGTQIFTVSKDEFIAVISGLSERHYGISYISIFNKQQNEWNNILTTDLDCFVISVSYDQANQHLYICGRSHKLLQFDLKTRKLSTLMVLHFLHACSDYQLIFAENQLHVLYTFCDNDNDISNDIHCVYDDATKQLKEINRETQQLKEINTGRETPLNIARHSIIYLKSQKCLLLFRNISKCIGDDASFEIICQEFVYKFSFKHRKWTELNVRIRLPKFWIFLNPPSLAKTKNDQYIFEVFYDDISIYDTKNNSFSQSKIKLKTTSTHEMLRKKPIGDLGYYAITTNDTKRDEILCFGFLNDFYQRDLVQLICCFFCDEELHLFCMQSPKIHYQINVDNVLQSETQWLEFEECNVNIKDKME